MNDGVKFILAVAATTFGVLASILTGCWLTVNDYPSAGILVVVSQIASVYGASAALKILGAREPEESDEPPEEPLEDGH